ncbi:TPA: methyltransferase type 11 [Candidatus Kaiserbacteria bacterium]|nr:MAG: Methyltransferase type 11 [Parcubacteria group bacterium GW2011_GWA1_56_13]KKW46300.1 MAG: Methyltransferase type 11 [Parcubacteria group bacterium GW2011_GWB1_57_6]HCR52228.1 methyltransferase type 11 [Candidatus Kaiserbacteria bacterium]
MTYQAQVGKSHYSGKAYRSLERWTSYWHQMDLMRRASPQTLLEIGVGDGVAARELSAAGISVTTVDIAEDLGPDVVGSITALPFPDKSFDAILAAEVLEHIRFQDVPQALSEMRRVARTQVLISLPHPGYVFSLIAKVPLLRRFSLLFKVPFFWKEHCFNGEHYWELGKKTFSLRTFMRHAEKAGLELLVSRSYADDPSHRFFLFKII